MEPKQWPATVDEAVGVVIATLSDEDKATIAAMAKSELIGLHFGLGRWSRNNLGLWKGNRALLEATGEADADDASMVIVVAAGAGDGAKGALKWNGLRFRRRQRYTKCSRPQYDFRDAS